MSSASLLRLGLLGLIWGSVFLWIKVAGYGFSPVQMVFARLAMGAAVLIAVVYARGLRLPKGGTLWLHLFAAAFLGNVLPWTLFAWGEQSASSSVAGVINSATPVWTVAIALLWRQESRLGGWRALGLALGLVGTLLIAAPWQSQDDNSTAGIVAFVVGTASLGASFAYMGRFLTNRGVPPLTLAASQLTAAALLLLPALPFVGLRPVAVRTDALVSLLVLGVVCTGLAYVLNFELIARDGPTAASTVTYLFPVVSVLLGALVLDERVGVNVLLGAVVVVGAIYFVRRRPAPPPARLPEPPPGPTTSVKVG